MGKVKDVLQNVFKLQKFRPLQVETINVTMARKDIFLVMPTGGGKSLCYQLPALCSDGMYRRKWLIRLEPMPHQTVFVYYPGYTGERAYVRTERNGEVWVGHREFTVLTGIQVGFSGRGHGVR